MLKQFAIVFVAVLVAAALSLFAYDRWVVAPRLAELGETQRVSLAEARDEATRIAAELHASVDRSVADAQAALNAQAAEVETRRAADAQRNEEIVETYRGQAQAADVLARAQMVKVALAEYRMSMGEWPADLAAAGLGAPEDHAGGSVASISLEADGVIAMHVRDDIAAGAVVRLVPRENGMGIIEWSCRASDYPAMAAVEACR